MSLFPGYLYRISFFFPMPRAAQTLWQDASSRKPLPSIRTTHLVLPRPLSHGNCFSLGTMILRSVYIIDFPTNDTRLS